MKNRIAACVIMLLPLVLSGAHAENSGMEISGAVWSMDGADFGKDKAWQKTFISPGDAVSLKIKRDKIGGAISVFTESEKRFGFGASLGYGLMPQVSYKVDFGGTGYTLTNKTSCIPLDVYLKFRPEYGEYRLFAGVGADYIMAKTDAVSTLSYLYGKDSFTQNKIVPHVSAGGEWFVNKSLSINAGVKYVFFGVLDKLRNHKERLVMVEDADGEYLYIRAASGPLAPDERPFKYDFSGLRFNIALRLYFSDLI